MPLYEYTCKKCGSAVELLIRSDEQPECPECGSKRLEKLLSVPAAHVADSSSLPVCPPCGEGNCGMPPCAGGTCPVQ